MQTLAKKPRFRPRQAWCRGQSAKVGLGGDILAAPVLDSGVVARDVLLPPGQWRDAWTGDRHAGGLKLQYPAPCPGMPVFVRAQAGELFASLHQTLKTIARGSIAPGVTTATYACGLNRDIKLTG